MISISLNEREIIEKYTNTPLSLIKNIDAFVENAQTKRKVIKRVSIFLTIEELDILITNIAKKANQNNTLPEIQYILDTLFGKLSIKYNANIVRE